MIKDHVEKAKLEKEIKARWNRLNISKKTGKPKPFPDKILEGDYILRGKTRAFALKNGKRLAKEMWGDRFEMVIATHRNKEHLHNHFVINSVSFADDKKYYDNTENYNLIKRFLTGFVRNIICRL